jgi:hypothetical protein
MDQGPECGKYGPRLLGELNQQHPPVLGVRPAPDL